MWAVPSSAVKTSPVATDPRDAPRAAPTSGSTVVTGRFLTTCPPTARSTWRPRASSSAATIVPSAPSPDRAVTAAFAPARLDFVPLRMPLIALDAPVFVSVVSVALSRVLRVLARTAASRSTWACSAVRWLSRAVLRSGAARAIGTNAIATSARISRSRARRSDPEIGGEIVHDHGRFWMHERRRPRGEAWSRVDIPCGPPLMGWPDRPGSPGPMGQRRARTGRGAVRRRTRVSAATELEQPGVGQPEVVGDLVEDRLLDGGAQVPGPPPVARRSGSAEEGDLARDRDAVGAEGRPRHALVEPEQPARRRRWRAGPASARRRRRWRPSPAGRRTPAEGCRSPGRSPRRRSRRSSPPRRDPGPGRRNGRSPHPAVEDAVDEDRARGRSRRARPPGRRRARSRPR